MKIFALIILATTLVGCGIFRKNTVIKAENSVVFVQGSNSKTIRNNGNIRLQRDAFSIQFSEFEHNSGIGRNATQVAILEDIEKARLAEIGASVDDIPYFRLGTGLSAYSDGYRGVITIGNYSHHFIIYEDNGSKRANLISRNGDLLRLELEIAYVFRDGEIIPLSQTDIRELYFVLLSDRNSNRIIDKGELTTVRVRFR